MYTTVLPLQIPKIHYHTAVTTKKKQLIQAYTGEGIHLTNDKNTSLGVYNEWNSHFVSLRQYPLTNQGHLPSNTSYLK